MKRRRVVRDTTRRVTRCRVIRELIAAWLGLRRVIGVRVAVVMVVMVVTALCVRELMQALELAVVVGRDDRSVGGVRVIVPVRREVEAG